MADGATGDQVAAHRLDLSGRPAHRRLHRVSHRARRRQLGGNTLRGRQRPPPADHRRARSCEQATGVGGAAAPVPRLGASPCTRPSRTDQPAAGRVRAPRRPSALPRRRRRVPHAGRRRARAWPPGTGSSTRASSTPPRSRRRAAGRPVPSSPAWTALNVDQSIPHADGMTINGAHHGATVGGRDDPDPRSGASRCSSAAGTCRSSRRCPRRCSTPPPTPGPGHLDATGQATVAADRHRRRVHQAHLPRHPGRAGAWPRLPRPARRYPSLRSRGSRSLWNSSRKRRWSWPGAWKTRWFRPQST